MLLGASSGPLLALTRLQTEPSVRLQPGFQTEPGTPQYPLSLQPTSFGGWWCVYHIEPCPAIGCPAWLCPAQLSCTLSHYSTGRGTMGRRTLCGADGPAFVSLWESWAHIAQPLWAG